MSKPTLYLMLGYPGAGKTTAAKYIHEITGAVHLWADHIRRERYGKPTYSHEENLDLYDHMNHVAAELLAAKNSVIFDTNFNFFKDREHLRQIAKDHGAEAVLVWVTTPKDTAKERAIDSSRHSTRVLGDMSEADFERLSSQLEKPRADEPRLLKIDGQTMTIESVRRSLSED